MEGRVYLLSLVICLANLPGCVLLGPLLLLNPVWYRGIICETGTLPRPIWSYFPGRGSVQPSFSGVLQGSMIKFPASLGSTSISLLSSGELRFKPDKMFLSSYFYYRKQSLHVNLPWVIMPYNIISIKLIQQQLHIIITRKAIKNTDSWFPLPEILT